MENYVNLHNHSIYSAMDAVCTPEQLIDKAVEYGHKAIAITEHGNFNSIPRFQKYALSKGIKPILGMEGYIVETLQKFDDKGKRIREKNNHVVLHAMNETGWKNLMKLNYLSNSDEEHFYYKPRNSFKELFEHSEGIMLGTACLASSFANLLKRGENEKAEELFQEFIVHFENRMYAEVQLNEVSYEDLSQKQYNDWLIFQATKNGIPIVISGDTHYVNKDDWSIQQMAFQISRDGIGEETQHVCKTIYYKGIEDYLYLNKALGFNYEEKQIREWCENSVKIADQCNYIYKPTTVSSLPRMAFDEEEEIKRLGIEGLKKYFDVDTLDACPKEYVDRLKMETSIIIKKGMMRYFLCLKDILDWCDEQKIPRGKGRGSACFLPDQLVTMIDGSKKKIVDIQEGDKVKTGFGFSSFVNKKIILDKDEDISITIPEKGEPIYSTKEHKILIVKKDKEPKIENAEWIEAKDIKPGDYLIKDL